jgi:hypothetical protein
MPPRLKRAEREGRAAGFHDERAAERERDADRAAAAGYEVTDAAASRLRGGPPAPLPSPRSTALAASSECPECKSDRPQTAAGRFQQTESAL